LATEEGIVIRCDGNRAWVKTVRTSSCEACASRGACASIGSGKEMQIEAINVANAVAGDHVRISFETASLVKVFSLVYLLPVVALLAGALIGQQLAPTFAMEESLSAVIGGGLFFFLSFWIIRSRGSQMAKDTAYQPKLIKILS